jgi:hypothetical protein
MFLVRVMHNLSTRLCSTLVDKCASLARAVQLVRQADNEAETGRVPEAPPL